MGFDENDFDPDAPPRMEWAEWKKIRRTHILGQRKVGDRSESKAHMFVDMVDCMGSKEILRALGEIGLGSGWFAEKIKELYDDQTTSKAAKLRLMTLLQKFVNQAEGLELTVRNTSDMRTREIEAEYVNIMERVEGGNGGQSLPHPESSGVESGVEREEARSPRQLPPAAEG